MYKMPEQLQSWTICHRPRLTKHIHRLLLTTSYTVKAAQLHWDLDVNTNCLLRNETKENCPVIPATVCFSGDCKDDKKVKAISDRLLGNRHCNN